MPLMLARIYEALIAAGAPPKTAEAAAEELAGYEQRFAKMEGDLFVLKWMTGGIYGLLVIIGVPAAWLLLKVALKVGAI